MTRLTLLFLIASLNSFGQCIDKDKIIYGGDWSNYNYTFFCHTYNFGFNGDTTENWGILQDPIHIRQIVKIILPVKDSVEKYVRQYSGEDFYSRMKFNSVEIVYKDSITRFAEKQPMHIPEKCKAKYFFYYNFYPDTLAAYNIGIAVDKEGKIISDFNFPSKNQYKIIDSSLTVCRVLNIAKQFSDSIEPIGQVQFDYDKKTKSFYWRISQKVVRQKEGMNEFNQILIDAADPKQIKKQIGRVHIDY